MTLLATQRGFIAHLLATDEAVPTEWDAPMRAGMAVYRNAYRARLIACLRESFEQLWAWIGDEGFDAAAAHHLILHPPHSWTLDDVGLGFADTLAGLFPNDPEVGELAWLEWEMARAFVAADDTALDAAGFAAHTSAYGEADWAAMRLDLASSLRSRPVRTACGALWTALSHDGQDLPDPLPLARPGTLIVWRSGLKPAFRVIEDVEARALTAMNAGQSFGDLCATLTRDMPNDMAATTAGSMLGRWIGDGLVAGIRR